MPHVTPDQSLYRVVKAEQELDPVGATNLVSTNRTAQIPAVSTGPPQIEYWRKHKQLLTAQEVYSAYSKLMGRIEAKGSLQGADYYTQGYSGYDTRRFFEALKPIGAQLSIRNSDHPLNVGAQNDKICDWAGIGLTLCSLICSCHANLCI